ncbi:ABC transporter permease [Candidatus Dactylopiibacterium carminicum]|uniref:ABC transporter permease n=1 Tax=Candidatus Dactylopiibacterium carminicum TaxID=857335 RepID=UPI0015CB1514|nr:hypothetical protein [Candidatus Dactylopiibacterium carminicum]
MQRLSPQSQFKISPQTLNRLAPWLLSVALLLLWEAICRGFSIATFLLPAPSVIFKVGMEMAAPIMQHSLHTFFTTLAGFAIAVVVGALLGMAVGSSPLIYKALYPLLVGFNSVPKVAFVPVLVVWFGIGTLPAIITAFLISESPRVS